MKVVIKKSPKAEKKLMAVFYDVDTSATKKTKKKYSKKVKTIHFGAAGMSDFTKHKDVARKQRYMNRHKKKSLLKLIRICTFYTKNQKHNFKVSRLTSFLWLVF